MSRAIPLVALLVGDLSEKAGISLEALLRGPPLQLRAERAVSEHHPADIGDLPLDQWERAQDDVVPLVLVLEPGDGQERGPVGARGRSRFTGQVDPRRDAV